MKSNFMHERLSSLEKQMQGALDSQVDDITERDARNVRILYRYSLLRAGGDPSHGESEDNCACLTCNIVGLVDQEWPITDICSTTSKDQGQEQAQAASER
jgi:hypothetical protein